MLKISETARDRRSIALRLEGRVVGPWVGELEKVAGEALSQGLRLVLDLAQVEFIDRDGVALFTRLAGPKVALVHCPRFVAELLKEVSPCRS